MKKQKQKLSLLIFALAIAVSSTVVIKPALATNYCVSDVCKAAAAEEAAALKKASDARVQAQTLEEEVERLNTDIEVMEAQIAANQAVVDDLKEQIKANKKKLKKQQAGLAELLVENHFDQRPNTVMMMASSNSLSDFAEKQSRSDTVKDQINQSVQAIKKTKEELEDQKAKEDEALETKKTKQKELANTRSEKNSLISQYMYDASSYASYADEARKIKEQEINTYRRSMGISTGGVTVAGSDSYPLAGQCPGINWRYTGKVISRYGGAYCECTGYAGWKAYEYWGVSIGWGDANYWATGARNAGYRVDNNPAPHTVGQYSDRAWGHVVWVESVNSDGTIDISEYNGTYVARYSYRTGVSASRFRYIHFD